MRRGAQSGFTLIETVLALAITALVLGGVVSAMAVASRASTAGAAAERRAAEVSEALAAISTLLRDASEVTRRTSTSVRFRSGDIDDDGREEIYELTWPGTGQSGPVTISVNGETASNLIERVAGLVVEWRMVEKPLPPDANNLAAPDYALVGMTLTVRVDESDPAPLRFAVRLLNAPEDPAGGK